MSELSPSEFPKIVTELYSAYFQADVSEKHGLTEAEADLLSIKCFERKDDLFLATQVGANDIEVEYIRKISDSSKTDSHTEYLGLLKWDNLEQIDELFQIHKRTGSRHYRNGAYYYFDRSKNYYLGAVIKNGKIMQFGDGNLIEMTLRSES